MKARYWMVLAAALLTGCAAQPKPGEAPAAATPPPAVEAAKPAVKPPPPKVALVLGGGAARGFAHVGVIKVLESQGIVPDMIVGTSAGSVVGAIYAAGYSCFELQEIAFKLDDDIVGDWTLPDRGIIRGEALQNAIGKIVQNRPIEKLKKPFAAVATDLRSGEMVVFRRGSTSQAVRASSSVPGVFQPVAINGHEYVDGGLVSPVPVKAARDMGADVIIAVDISSRPERASTDSVLEILLQTFAIMGRSIISRELPDADVVIRPDTSGLSASDFQKKHEAIFEGEKAAQKALPLIRQKLQQAATPRAAPVGAPR